MKIGEKAIPKGLNPAIWTPLSGIRLGPLAAPGPEFRLPFRPQRLLPPQTLFGKSRRQDKIIDGQNNSD